MNTAKKSLKIGITLLLISITIFPSFNGKEIPNSDSSDDLPNFIWSKTYGSGSAKSVQQTSDDGYILCGIASGYAILIKADENGNEEWATNFEGKYGDEAYDAIECSDGGYICTGGKSGKTFLIKTDNDGNIMWSKNYRRHDRNGPSWGDCVIEVVDGYVILASLPIYGSTENCAVWLIKTDLNGNELWNVTYGGDSMAGESGSSIIKTDDGGYIIVGDTYSFDMGGGDAWLLKIDSEGNELWNKSYGGYSYDTGKDFIQTDDGGYLIAGHYTPIYETWSDVGLIKTDDSGNVQWIRHYGGTDNDFGNSVTMTDDGGYAVVGIRHSGLPDFTGWMLKTDGNGNKLWDKVIGGRPDEIIKSNDGNYVVAGLNNGIWLLKIEDFENNLPSKPSHRYDETWQHLKVASIDPDSDRIRYGISWYNNGVVDEWTDYFDSGEEGSINCFGKDKPAYVIAEDEHGGQSEWVMAKSKVKPFNPLFQLLERLLNEFSILEYLLRFIE